MTYADLKARISRGDVIILDGGTGTDIQQRGAPMSSTTWCADANITHPHIVQQVHAAYADAGADVITANTFATSPLLFSHLGRDDEVARIDATAMALARQAVAGRPVLVAGSMSTMRPMQQGSDRNNLSLEWPEHEARRLFRAKADGLKQAGVDFIMLELLRDTDYAVWASEAALQTGLPVWIGLSTERDESGALQGWGRPDCSFDAIAARLSALKPDVMAVMHTSPADTADALDILKRHWHGPLAAYPESGYFKSPDWSFVDVISPDDLIAFARGWRSQGVTILGGCCGIGPQHIGRLAQEFKQ